MSGVLKMATNPLLTGKVAVITGAAGKFGKVIATRFVQHGAQVILADKNYNDCLILAGDLNKITSKAADAVNCDVTKPSNIDDAIKQAKQTFGKLDIFYNNAGVNTVSPIDYSNVFENTMAVNVNSVLASIEKAAKAMKPAGGGCILCTGSTMGLLGDVVPSAYSISKTAVMAVIQAKAAELASDGVRVNAISPAANVDTSMLQKFFTDATHQQLDDMIKKYMTNRLVDENDVANAAVYLASDDGKSVTGHNHVLKGMYTV